MQLAKNEKYWRVRIFLITWVAYAGFYLCRKNFSVVMPLLSRELGTTKEEFAIAITSYSLMYMLGQFISGYLNDRKGPRLIVTIGIALSVFANILMGWGGTIAGFVFLMGLNGLGQSTGWSGTVKNMTPWFKRKERGTVMSFWTTNYVIGGIAATALATFLATNPLISSDLGWRRAFWIPAIALAMVGAAYALLTRNKPSEAIQITQDTELPPKSIFKQKTKKKRLPKEIIQNPAIWTAASVYFFVKFTRYAFLFWLPLYLTEALNYSDVDAGYTSIAFESVGFLGILAAGFISDKLMNARRFPVSTIMLSGLAIILLFQPLLTSMGSIAIIICIGLTGFFIYGPDSLLSGATAMDLGKEENAALAAGIINGVGSVGQLVSPLIVAYVTSRWGWDQLFQLFVAFAIVAAILSLTQWNLGRKIRVLKPTEALNVKNKTLMINTTQIQ
jgi:MFS transporter, OPA family, sugar phosphate sensor protein UhpC